MIITTDKQMRPRDQHDFYPTPLAVASAALELIPQTNQYRVLDPGAGTGVWGQAAHKRYPNAWIAGVELRNVLPNGYYTCWYQERDYLDPLLMLPQFDLIIGNPPYKHAEAFIRRSFEVLNDGGCILFLLRLAFLEGQARARGLYREFPLKEVHVLSARPSFIPEGEKAGRTDATAYAIFIWEKGWTGDTRLAHLDWKV